MKLRPNWGVWKHDPRLVQKVALTKKAAVCKHGSTYLYKAVISPMREPVWLLFLFTECPSAFKCGNMVLAVPLILGTAVTWVLYRLYLAYTTSKV